MTCSEPSRRGLVGCPGPKDWSRRPGRPRHTWQRTLEADLQPLNHGLNSAWRLTQDRGNGYARHGLVCDDDDDDIMGYNFCCEK